MASLLPILFGRGYTDRCLVQHRVRCKPPKHRHGTSPIRYVQYKHN